MNREHILPQEFGLTSGYPGPYPDARFRATVLEELYLAVCQKGYEFRHFERIGVDAGARMYTPGVNECRIEVGKISIQDRLDISFDAFRPKIVDLLRTIVPHVRAEPLFGAQINLSAVWPTEHQTDLRTVFTPRFVNVNREQLEVLGAEIENTALSISCSRSNGDEPSHYTFELEPDAVDHHRLRVSVDAHFHALIDDFKKLDGILQDAFDFMMNNVGRFVESLGIE